MTSQFTTALVAVSDLTIQTPQRTLISHASFVLTAGRHVALVGRNGGGKTSLLDLIASRCSRGRLTPHHLSSTGEVAVVPGLSCGYAPQHPDPEAFAGTVSEYLDARAGVVAQLHRRHEQLAVGLDSDARIAAYAEVVERLTALQAWSYPNRRTSVLTGIGLGTSDLGRRLATLSGGEATKVALAGLLLCEPDLLLLDEPTNNLDASSLEFLREWVRDTPAAVLLVSHDRAFLDATIEEILEIDEESGAVKLYGGNYSFYRQRKAEEFDNRLRRYEEQVAQRDALLLSARRLSATAAGFQSRSSNDYYRARGKKIARRGTVQMARIERQLSDLEVPRPPRRPQIELTPVALPGARLVHAQAIGFAHPQRRQLFTDVSLSVHGGERIGIVGPNGAGKTTLLRILLGEIQPTSGTLWLAPGLRVGYLPQSVATGTVALSAIEHARRIAGISEERARELIGKVVFADVGDMPLSRYSAGERRRIELAVFFAGSPDLVVLDEPTNHLDLPTIEMLEEALTEYQGAILAVSHDQRFVESCRLGQVIALPGPSSNP